LPIYRQPTTTLGSAAPLYKTHSRNRRAAPRFSPTRFIPLAAIGQTSPQLDYSHALGDKTLYVGQRNTGAYQDRQYRAYLVLGDLASSPLWEWPRWLEFSAAFDPVLKMCRGHALLRIGQFTKEKKKKEVKFGRLVWNPASFQKWTHGSPLNDS